MCTGTTATKGVSVAQVHGAQAALHKMLPLMFSREQGMLLAAHLLCQADSACSSAVMLSSKRNKLLMLCQLASDCQQGISTVLVPPLIMQT